MVWFHFCVVCWGREKRVREEKKRDVRFECERTEQSGRNHVIPLVILEE